MSALEDTIVSLIPDWPNLATADRTMVAARCAVLVRRQIGLSPFHIRLGFVILFAAFRIFVLLRVVFTSAASERSAELEKFSATPSPVLFSVERLLRSTTMLHYFEQPEVLAALGEETIAERQEEFRSRRIWATRNRSDVRSTAAIPEIQKDEA